LEENLVDSYYQEILKTTDPGGTLAKFLWSCLQKKPEGSDIAVMRKLVRIYGRWDVFYAILDLVDVSSVDHSKYYGLLVYFIKKKIEERYKSLTDYQDLSTFVDNVKASIGKNKLDIDRLRGLLNEQ
jgi:hypothetical protein